MKRHLFKASLVWTGILLSITSYGQEIPLGALPMQYNSSFAGEADGPRVSSNYRLGFPNKGQFYFGTPYKVDWQSDIDISYDQFFSAIRSGIGISLNYRDHPGKPLQYKGVNFGIAIAPKFSINGKYTISPSLDFAYERDMTSYDFYNNLDSIRYSNKSQVTGLRSRAAILMNTSKWYIGYSINLYSKYQYRDIVSDSLGSWRKTGFRSYWQLGYTFQRSSESKFSFTPQLVFRTGDDYSGKFRYFYFEAINLTFRYQKFIWGLSNVGYHIGFQNKKMRIFLTSEFKRRTFNSPYIGNLSFRYTFKKDSTRPGF